MEAIFRKKLKVFIEPVKTEFTKNNLLNYSKFVIEKKSETDICKLFYFEKFFKYIQQFEKFQNELKTEPYIDSINKQIVETLQHSK